jgi:hypothetical protein
MQIQQWICPPQPQNLLKFSTDPVARTAIRHRLARTTILCLDRADPLKLQAAATFVGTIEAHEWASTLANTQPHVTLAILNKYGECIATLNSQEHLKTAASNWAETIWRGAAPIPRRKTKPRQPELLIF